MQEIHDLHQGFLRFILSGNIRKCHAGLFLHVHLGIALADAHDAAADTAAAPHGEHEDAPDKQYGEHIDQELGKP